MIKKYNKKKLHLGNGNDYKKGFVNLDINKKIKADVYSDMESMLFKDNYFDYVTSLGSLEHYLHPEIGIREIRRVLKPDGLSCIMVPNSFSLKDIFMVMTRGGSNIDEQEVVSRSATKNEWGGLIEKNGFKITKTYRYNEFHPLFKKGTLKLKSLKKFGKSLLIRLICPFNLAELFFFLAVKN